MTARALIATALALTAVAAGCAAARSEECSVSEDCWDGLVCAANPVVCTVAPCDAPAATCERPCDDETPCGPRDYCSVNTFTVRSTSDSLPVRVCIPPKRDGGA